MKQGRYDDGREIARATRGMPSMIDHQEGLGFVVAQRSHPGHVRALNEDAVVIAPPVVAVADGMGGHEHGEVASRIAAEVMIGFGREGQHDFEGLERALALANARIREETAREDGTGAGTTLVGLVLTPGRPFAFNVGDSRLYRYSDGHLSQLSRDHSAVQEMIDAGVLTREEGAVHPQGNVITRAIGADPTIEADVWPVETQVGDRFILASDGLTGEVDDQGIGEIVARSRDVEDAADMLLAAALDAGGHDNISVAVVEVVDVPEDQTPDTAADDDTERRSREHSGDTTERRRRTEASNPARQIIGIEDVLGAGQSED